MSVVTTETEYAELLERVRAQIVEGRERVRRVVERETVRLYWEVGGTVGSFLERVDKHYGKQVIGRLSQDTGLSPSILYEAVRFRSLYSNFSARRNLSWTHYRRVLHLENPEERDFYLRSADRFGWTVRELEAQIRSGSFVDGGSGAEPGAQSSPRLHAKRGEPYVYRVIERWGRRVLDLGFRSRRVVPVSTDLEVGAIVRSTPDARFDSGYRIEPAGLRRRIYAYKATAYRIIDGDTLWALVDLGFEHLTEVKLRLRGIDADEKGTPAGLRATDYLARTLEEAGDFVVTTTKVDLYDRYLADVFVLPGQTDVARIAADGAFVNREMVEARLARLWTDEKPPEF